LLCVPLALRPVAEIVATFLQNWRNRISVESLNGGLFRLRADVAVAFEHLTADVSREGLDCLFADCRIFRKARYERVAHIVWSVAHASGFAGEPPRLSPGTNWTAQIDAPQSRYARASSETYLVVREDEAIRTGFGESF